MQKLFPGHAFPFICVAMQTVLRCHDVDDKNGCCLLDALPVLFDNPVVEGGAEALSLEDAAAQLSDPSLVHGLLQVMIIAILLYRHQLMDILPQLEALARHYQINESAIAMLQRYVAGDIAGLKRYFKKHSYLAHAKQRIGQEQGLIQRFYQYGLMHSWFFLRPSKKIAQRYYDLADYPKDSLGFQLWLNITESGFHFPGEKGGFIETIIWHDLLHILTGYDTSFDGEIDIAAFQAGMIPDGFYIMVFVFLQFEFGVKIAELAPAATDKISRPELVERLLAAWQRGLCTPFDFAEQWNFYPDLQLAVAEVRRKYAIPPF